MMVFDFGKQFSTDLGCLIWTLCVNFVVLIIELTFNCFFAFEERRVLFNCPLESLCFWRGVRNCRFLHFVGGQLEILHFDGSNWSVSHIHVFGHLSNGFMYISLYPHVYSFNPFLWFHSSRYFTFGRIFRCLEFDKIYSQHGTRSI